ncbi:MAG TPA: DUF6797 domain-containing protein, partial [Opitutus sp.]|nr:DUF6797 domain-containing protein [Opitutus sp.]
MILRRRFSSAYLCALVLLSCSHAAQEPGPFFEPDQPFFHTQIEISAATSEAAEPNFVVRGVLIPLEGTHAVGFDQELLRVAGFWTIPGGEPPITLETMAQTSYARPRKKSSTVHPTPTGPRLLSTGMHPGVSSDLEALFVDPRPLGREGDFGRGPLPADFARFEGIEAGASSAVLRYRSGDCEIREWFELLTTPTESRFLRHLEIAAHAGPLHFALGAPAASNWQLQPDGSASAQHPGSGYTRFATNSDGVALSIHHGELVATVPPGSKAQRITLAFAFTTDETTSTRRLSVDSTPPAPATSRSLRWPEAATSRAELESLAHNGLTLDRIAVPEENPWQRRVRPADLAFLDHDRAAVVTYDGDVWLVSGLNDPELSQLSWKRFASGLHEPLAITAPGGVIQVATKNGVVRIHDRDRNGEADWYENFNDQLIQSQNTRSFALDMAMAPDGSTFITQGGIVDQSGIKSGGTGTVHSGGFLKISPDGRSSTLFAKLAREPFVTVHQKTGIVTGTDQQGHYVPASATYLIREDDSFGFLEAEPAKLTPPLAWIPHDQDTSSSSQVWTSGGGLGPWSDRLLHLSYGTGRIFVIAPDLTAPIPQAAVIPLDLKTELPLLHGRMHPAGDNLFLAGFQIWGTRTTTWWGLGRLRSGRTPVVSAINARSLSEGVILDFAEPVDPASLKAENVTVRAWNYRRSAEYGSGRYTLDGHEG